MAQRDGPNKAERRMWRIPMSGRRGRREGWDKIKAKTVALKTREMDREDR